MVIHRSLPLNLIGVAVLVLSGGALTPVARAQQDASPATTAGSFQESMARAKETGAPLIVFGLSDTCPRCQAVKQGVASDPEFRLLLTQYVSTEVPFGGREFATIYRDIARQDSDVPSAIGAPSVFIFTSQGKPLYAGPDRETGIALDDEFKDLLISGIKQNGGIRFSEAADQRSLATDVAKARRLMGEHQPAAAAAILAKHLAAPQTGNDGQLTELIRLTGLEVANSKAQDQLEDLTQQLTEKVRPSIQAAVALGETQKATIGAVRLAELDRGFADFPPLAPALEDAWQELEKSSEIPGLRQQAQMIDKARQAEVASDRSAAVAAYEQVISAFPDTSAAKLSQLRASQLQPRKPKEMRVWTSKNGQFSVNAVLLSFEDGTVRLRSDEGKAIAVAAGALSAEDQQFLQNQQVDESDRR